MNLNLLLERKHAAWWKVLLEKVKMGGVEKSKIARPRLSDFCGFPPTSSWEMITGDYSIVIELYR